MGEYDRAAALALRLIAKKGRPVSIRALADPVPADPAKPWVLGPAVSSDEATSGVSLSVSQTDLADSRVKVTDEKIMVPATAVEPTTASKLVDGTRVLDVAAVHAVQPGPTVLLRYLFCREG